MPKKIPKKVLRGLAKLSEEVIKEGVKQPAEIVRAAGKQTGFLPKGWGEKPEAQISTRMMQEKEEERRKKLARARKRIREMTPAPSQTEPKIPQEKIKEQKELAEEAEKKKGVPKVPSKKPRGLSLRIKKRRGTGEIKTGI